MTDQDTTPAEASFDELARGVGDGSLSRRRALALVGSSLLGGTLGSLALWGDAEAKSCKAKCNEKNDKKAKKKCKKKCDKKEQNITPPPNPAPVGAVVSCPNIGTACGLGANTLICNCRLTQEGTQVCANVVNPPNGAAFQACQQTANCPPGQICDFTGKVCRSTCQTA